MRFFILLFLSLLILTKSHSQLLPTTVKKIVAVKKPTSAKKNKKPPAEPIKETATTHSMPIEYKKEVQSIGIEEKKSTLKITSDVNATVFLNGEKVGAISKESDYNLSLNKGTYNIKVVSERFPISEIKESYSFDGSGVNEIWNIRMKNNEINFWGDELIKTIKPYILLTSTTNMKVNKKWMHYTGTTDNFKIQDSSFIVTYLTNSYDDKKIILSDATLVHELPITYTTTFSFILNEIKNNDPHLLLILKGNGSRQIIDNITKKFIEPKSKSNDFILTILKSSQKELEPKLNALFKQKPF